MDAAASASMLFDNQGMATDVFSVFLAMPNQSVSNLDGLLAHRLAHQYTSCRVRVQSSGKKGLMEK
jgi:hypothetical protein